VENLPPRRFRLCDAPTSATGPFLRDAGEKTPRCFKGLIVPRPAAGAKLKTSPAICGGTQETRLRFTSLHEEVHLSG
jgi:hypothetical protein